MFMEDVVGNAQEKKVLEKLVYLIVLAIVAARNFVPGIHRHVIVILVKVVVAAVGIIVIAYKVVTAVNV